MGFPLVCLVSTREIIADELIVIDEKSFVAVSE